MSKHPNPKHQLKSIILVGESSMAKYARNANFSLPPQCIHFISIRKHAGKQPVPFFLLFQLLDRLRISGIFCHIPFCKMLFFILLLVELLVDVGDTGETQSVCLVVGPIELRYCF